MFVCDNDKCLVIANERVCVSVAAVLLCHFCAIFVPDAALKPGHLDRLDFMHQVTLHVLVIFLFLFLFSKTTKVGRFSQPHHLKYRREGSMQRVNLFPGECIISLCWVDVCVGMSVWVCVCVCVRLFLRIASVCTCASVSLPVR